MPHPRGRSFLHKKTAAASTDAFPVKKKHVPAEKQTLSSPEQRSMPSRRFPGMKKGPFPKEKALQGMAAA